MPLRVILGWLVVALGVWSCEPQCEQVSPAPVSVCREINDGVLEVGVPFSIRASPELIAATCQVVVNGTQVELTLSGFSCTPGGSGSAKRAVPNRAGCAVPALDAGTYSVSGTTMTFTVPSTGGTSLPPCT